MTQKPLSDMTAEDLMSCDVKTIPQDMPLRAAAQLLKREHISGAPVVNAEGRCVGVLSTTDFLTWAEKGGKSEPIGCVGHPDVCSEWQVIDVEVLPRDEVRFHMSIDVVTTSPATPITELARQMLNAHIHRIFVVDSYRRPIGVVSTTDIVAAVAYANAGATA
jgi:CBS-domain-containing membrane protein